jgi:hypothetical protein
MRVAPKDQDFYRYKRKGKYTHLWAHMVDRAFPNISSTESKKTWNKKVESYKR